MAPKIHQTIADSNTLIFLFIFLLTLAAFGLIFNILVFIVIKKSKILSKNLSNMLILHLSGVESFGRIAFIINALHLVFKGQSLDEEACVLVYTANGVLNCVVVCLLAGISLDRWVNITNPFRGRIISHRWRIKGHVLVWIYSILSILLTIPFSISRKNIDSKASNDTWNSFAVCVGKQTTEAKCLIMTNFVLRSVVPLIIIYISYIKILTVLRKRSKSKVKSHHARHPMVSSTKAIKVFFFACMSYVVCWFPFGSYLIVSSFSAIDHFSFPHILLLKMVGELCGRFGTILSPLIYAFYNPQFRAEFRRFLRGRRDSFDDLNSVRMTRLSINSASSTITVYSGTDAYPSRKDSHLESLRF